MSLVDPQGNSLKTTPRVLIAVPARDQVHTGFAHDLAQMIGVTSREHPEIALRLSFNKGTLLASQRASLVYDALANDATHILWLDSDMRFPNWTLLKLLAHEKPVVAANYVTRRHPIRPVTMKVLGDLVTSQNAVRVYTEPGSTGVERVEGIGFGCVLMDVDLFQYLPQPWFIETWREIEPEPGRKLAGYVSEDMFFCDRLRTAEIEVLVDHDLSAHIRHEGSWDYSHDHALVQREAVHAEPARDLELHGTPSGT